MFRKDIREMRLRRYIPARVCRNLSVCGLQYGACYTTQAIQGKIDIPPQAYTADEVVYILDCAKKEPLVWQAMILFLSDSGCRIGECTGLLWKNVNLDTGEVIIDGSLNYTSSKGVFRGPTKNGRSRKFKVSDDVLALIKLLKEHQDITVHSDYVFALPCNIKPIHPQSPGRYFHRFGEKYGIEHFHPHKLRHTYISIAITNGADPVSVAEKVGHKNVAVSFEKYAHSNQQKIDGTTEIFREALKKEKK